MSKEKMPTGKSGRRRVVVVPSKVREEKTVFVQLTVQRDKTVETMKAMAMERMAERLQSILAP